MSDKTILVTGAAGFIGSHTWCALAQAGFQIVGLDNLSNSDPAVIDRIAHITGASPIFFEGDARDEALLTRIFTQHKIDAVVHFAALKAVGDSVAQPLWYYDNNLNALLKVCDAMRTHAVKTFILSSSATVYGDPASVPITEDFPLSATNPYGQTKLISEQILRDQEIADPDWRVATLRYFNPVGAHPSGLIGENPNGVPNNLMPYVAQVAIGKLASLRIFGNDYATADGTGVRDYIHVMDLAEGHVAALRRLFDGAASLTVNLATGRGYSVLELLHAYEQASGRTIAYQFAARRPGDIAVCYADPALAKSLLGWQAERSLETMCADVWRWQLANPNGFQPPAAQVTTKVNA
jgi:UDP-glucose 4-epimerase